MSACSHNVCVANAQRGNDRGDAAAEASDDEDRQIQGDRLFAEAIAEAEASDSDASFGEVGETSSDDGGDAVGTIDYESQLAVCCSSRRAMPRSPAPAQYSFFPANVPTTS